MAVTRTAVIREAVGDYRKGETLWDAKLQEFLDTKPDPNSYHLVQATTATSDAAKIVNKEGA